MRALLSAAQHELSASLYRVCRMVADYLLFTLNYEVAVLPKMLAVPGVKSNFMIQYKQRIVLDHTDHPVAVATKGTE